MRYKFPAIDTIDDVHWAIEDCPEIPVHEKDGYTVINYQLSGPDTFPEVVLADPDNPDGAREARKAKIRRECRGLIFDESGKLIRRPFHKFFNMNERPETQAHLIDLTTNHIILDKLDGSMIAPFIVNDRVIWGTRAGDTDVGALAEAFVADKPHYEEMVRLIISQGATPMFEFLSRKQRIVIDHEEENLVLTAVRGMQSGDYINYHHLQSIGEKWNVPVVDHMRQSDVELAAFKDANVLGDQIKDSEGSEGVIIRFFNGHCVKVKSDWYVAIHKAKESILWDRNIARLWFDGEIDDIVAQLPPEDADGIWEFIGDLAEAIGRVSRRLHTTLHKARWLGRKEFATGPARDMLPQERAVVFRLFDSDPSVDATNLRAAVRDTIINSTSSNKKFEELRSHWFPDAVFNERIMS